MHMHMHMYMCMHMFMHMLAVYFSRTIFRSVQKLYLPTLLNELCAIDVRFYSPWCPV